MEKEKTLQDHALLIGVCGRYVYEHYPAEAEELLGRITGLYGKRRGERMRKLTIENNEQTDLTAFFVHGEWQGRPGENLSEMTFEENQTLCQVSRCAWNDTWRKYGLLKEGKYYCRYIDKAIAEAYEGGFSLQVEKTLTDGEGSCLFCWKGKADEAEIKRKKQENGERWILPFTWHFNEYLSCIEEVLTKADKENILKDHQQLSDHF